MAEENINTSQAHLKELKSQTHDLLTVTHNLRTVMNELGMASYWLQKIHKSFTKVCNEMDNRVV